MLCHQAERNSGANNMADFSGKRVLLMAGGTGGHVIPGLSLAKSLLSLGAEVEWLGSERGIENRLVPEAGLTLHKLSISGVRGKGRLSLLKAPFMLLSAVIQANRIFKTFKPDLVVGMGGFAAAPGGLAAYINSVPLLIHEQNAVAGTTNKLLSRFAKQVFTAFPGVFPSSSKVRVVGNPVRDEIECIPALDAELVSQKRSLSLLVLGGSLGALALNQTVPKAVSLLVQDYALSIVHQCGEKHLNDTKTAYEPCLGALSEVSVLPFIDDMGQAYQAADVVICRAGALTVSEVAAAKRPAIFVPYPYAIDDHQSKNADYLVSAKAAIKIEQSELSSENLAAELKTLIENKQKIIEMSKSAGEMAKPKAMQSLIHYCAEVLSV